KARFRRVERGCHDENRLALLPGHDPPRGEAAAVPQTLDLKKDRLVRIAAQQKIGVQGMGGAGLDRALRGDQRLRQHLAAEYPLPAVMRRMADKTIRAGRLEIEQRHKFVSGHKASTPMRDDLGVWDG